MGQRRKGALPARVGKVQRTIEKRRRTREKRMRMAEELWSAAVELAQAHGDGVWRIAHELRVSYESLKERVVAAKAGDRQSDYHASPGATVDAPSPFQSVATRYAPRRPAPQRAAAHRCIAVAQLAARAPSSRSSSSSPWGALLAGTFASRSSARLPLSLRCALLTFRAGLRQNVGRHDRYDPSTTQILAAVLELPVTAKHLVSGDFDQDGVLDLVVGSDGIVPGTDTRLGVLSLFRGLGDGTFASETTMVAQPSLAVRSLAAGDMDGDGVLDVVVASREGALGSETSVVFVLYGETDAPPEPTIKTFDAQGCCIPTDLVIGDLNGDGLPDIAVAIAAGGDPSISVLFNEGERSFETVRVRPNAVWPMALAVANIDSDPRLELGFLELGKFGYIDMIRVPSQGPRAIDIVME